MTAFIVEQVNWRQSKHRLKRLRDRVYVCEWRIPKQIEFDQQDQLSNHVLVKDTDGNEIATGRITPEGEIGRIAVVSKYRGKEIYDLLFNALLGIAKEKELSNIYMQCELDGIDHFQQKGFDTVGNVYMDSGRPRQRIRCPINRFSWSKVELTH